MSQIAVARAAFCLVLLLATRSAAQPASWQEAGPHSIGGRVSALAVDPANPSRVVVGTPAGGVWESVDAGASWRPLTVWLARVPLSAIAVSPTDSRRIVAGSGSVSDAGAVGGAVGVLRTADGGVTWSLDDGNGTGPYVADLLLWPGEPQRVLAATDLGVRLSRNGGATWQSALAGEAVSVLAADPWSPEAAFAATRSGLFRSEDRGASWSRVSDWPLLPTDKFGAGRANLAVSSTTPGRLYATVQVLGTLSRTDRALLLRSHDGGETFETLALPDGFCPPGATCGFAQALALDPADDRRLLLGGEAISASSDGGATWHPVAGGLSGCHDAVSAGGKTYLAGRFGVAVLDAGWTSASTRNEGLAVTPVLGLDASPGPPFGLLAATGDSGTLLGTGVEPSWRTLFSAGQTVGPARFDPFTPSRILASRPGGLVFRSDDDGATFEPAQDGLDLDQAAADFAPLVPDPLEPDKWYTGRLQVFSSTDAGGSWTGFRPPGLPELGVISPSPVVPGRVYFATRRGGDLYKADADTTEKLTVDDGASLRIDAVFLDPLAQNRIYVGATDTAGQVGRIFKSADFGVTWTDTTPPGLAPVSSLVKDRFGALYAGARDGVWRSANDGFSWVPFRRGFLAGGVNDLRLAGGHLFAATNGRGVFRTPEQELVSIESIPPGIRFLVDGEEVEGPYLVHWEPGTVHTVTPLLQGTSQTREQFLAWFDGGSAEKTLAAPPGGGWLMAAVERKFRLDVASTPAGGGSVLLDPPSADGFYADRSFVKVVPAPASDQRFTGFSGELSGTDGLIGLAFMDRPRALTAAFEPLRTTLKTDPPGIPLTVDGVSVHTPTTFQWTAGSNHEVAAPETVGGEPDAPLLAFDGWTDLRPRTHTVTVARDAFVPDLTARFISTVRQLAVPAGGARRLATTGAPDSPRLAALALSPAAGAGTPALQLVRGRLDATTTSELVLAASSPREWTSSYVEQSVDGANGRVRVALFNPGAEEARVGLLLRDDRGRSLAARTDALVVPPGAHVTARLDEVLPLPATFQALLTLIADRPVVTSVHEHHGNLRPATFRYDPLLLARFTQGDAGVPLDARLQALLLTPDTRHQVVLANIGFSGLSGSVEFEDDAGAALPLALDSGEAVGAAYDLPPGGWLRLEFPTPAGSAGVPFRTARIRVTPSPGQPAPALQLFERQTIPAAEGPAAVLPRAVPPSAVGRVFRLPADLAARDTGAVLANVAPVPATVTARATEQDGTEAGVFSLTVAAGGQATVSASQLPAGAGAPFAGTLTLASDIPLYAVGWLRLVNERGEEIVAGYPLLTDAEPAAAFPLAIDGDSWRSEWWVLNPSAAEARSELTFRGAEGRRAYFPFE